MDLTQGRDKIMGPWTRANFLEGAAGCDKSVDTGVVYDKVQWSELRQINFQH